MDGHLHNFDDLPNSALVSFKTAAAVTGLSESTLWRQSQTDPLLKTVRLGTRATRLVVGNLRRFMAGIDATEVE